MKKTTAADALRVHTVSTRLSGPELRQLNAIAGERGIAEVVREVILAAVAHKESGEKPDPVLSEIVGVRLLLVNLLRPRESARAPLSVTEFDSLLEEIKRMKRQVAKEVERESRKGKA